MALIVLVLHLQVLLPKSLLISKMDLREIILCHSPLCCCALRLHLPVTAYLCTQALKVQDVFIKQLLQLHGISAEKAQAIVEWYPTPRVLMAAFQAEGSAGEKLLANIRYGSLNRLTGPVISRTIHKFYTNHLLS